jgi:hypothetical protein
MNERGGVEVYVQVNFDTIWRRLTTFTLLSLYPSGNTPHIQWIGEKFLLLLLGIER